MEVPEQAPPFPGERPQASAPAALTDGRAGTVWRSAVREAPYDGHDATAVSDLLVYGG